MSTLIPDRALEARYDIPESWDDTVSQFSIDELNQLKQGGTELSPAILNQAAALGLVFTQKNLWWFSAKGEAFINFLRNPVMTNNPTDGLSKYSSIKTVLAAEIIQPVEGGCLVRKPDGEVVKFAYQFGMTARYEPQAGDFWVIYPDGYESLSPRQAFLDGYVEVVTFQPTEPEPPADHSTTVMIADTGPVASGAIYQASKQ